MLLGCSESDFYSSSILKKAVGIIKDPDELFKNDYRRIMILQKIAESIYKTLKPKTKNHKDYIYEKECFMPFVRKELDQGAENCDLTILLGLMTNTYRDAHCVINTNTINIPVTEYICSIVQKEISSIGNMDLSELAKSLDEVKPSLLNNASDLYFEGSMEASAYSTILNGEMRDLMLVLLYSIGYREGVVEDSPPDKILDDLKDQS